MTNSSLTDDFLKHSTGTRQKYDHRDTYSVVEEILGRLWAQAAMEHSGSSEAIGADTVGPAPQLVVTMGLTGFGKKACTFDLETMFEQT